MKDNYDFSKMRKVPHPLLGKTGKLIDNVGGISDAEFERKLQDLEPDERIAARRQRKIRQSSSSISA
jgi:hypothetical protein